MHRIFYPLKHRQISFLLTLLAHGGNDAFYLFDYLNEDETRAIKPKADAIAQIPGEKRALFIAHEFKNLMMEKSDRGLELVEPEWIIDAFSDESPRTIAAILMSLPPQILKPLIEALPKDIRQSLPPKDEMKEIHPNVLEIICQRFSQRLVPMPLFGDQYFEFRDVIHLDIDEILLLIKLLGLEELARAFVTVGRYALAELCRRLPRPDAEQLIAVVKQTKQVDAMELKDAQRFLGRILSNFDTPQDLFNKAGLYRLARAVSIEDELYRSALMQRLPKVIAHQLEHYVRKMHEQPEMDEPLLRAAQKQILSRIFRMAHNKEISPRYLQYKFALDEALPESGSAS